MVPNPFKKKPRQPGPAMPPAPFGGPAAGPPSSFSPSGKTGFGEQIKADIGLPGEPYTAQAPGGGPESFDQQVDVQGENPFAPESGYAPPAQREAPPFEEEGQEPPQAESMPFMGVVEQPPREEPPLSPVGDSVLNKKLADLREELENLKDMEKKIDNVADKMSEMEEKYSELEKKTGKLPAETDEDLKEIRATVESISHVLSTALPALIKEVREK